MEEKIQRRRSNPNRKVGASTDNFHRTAVEKAITDKKVYEIAKLLAKGVSKRDILQSKAEEWECTEQNVNYFINKAYKSMAHSIDKRIERVLGLQRERLELILNGAIEKRDFATAQKIIDTMNKLYGLYEEKKKVSIDAGTIKFDFGNITSNEEDVNSEQ